MKILSVKTVKNETIFQAELDAKRWKTATANTKKNVIKNISIPGFRKGHAPQFEIDKRVSTIDIAMRTLDKMRDEIAKGVLASKEFKDSDCIDSITNMNIKKLTPVPVIDVHMENIPKVTGFEKKDVNAISIPPFKAPEISDDVIKNQIKMMIKPDAMVSVKKDGVVAKGNIAVINFKGFVDGKAFAGGEGKNFELEIGSKTFIDNFEDQLIGCKKGDKKTVNVNFPKEYGVKNLAGKPAKFEVKINDVKEIEYPEITKDYCKKFAMDCANMKELEKHIKDLFMQEAEMKYQDNALRIINNVIANKAKLDYYPAGLLSMHKNQILRQYEQEAQRAGFKTLQQYKKYIKVDEKKFDQILNNSAKATLNVSLAYEKLMEDYDLEVTPADTKDYLSKLTRYVGDEKRAKEMYEKNKEMAESNILRDKLFKKLVQEAKKEEPKKAEKKAK